ncbi:MAG: hypothetical protein QM642_08445, partial [Edaphocola sp.]
FVGPLCDIREKSFYSRSCPPARVHTGRFFGCLWHDILLVVAGTSVLRPSYQCLVAFKRFGVIVGCEVVCRMGNGRGVTIFLSLKKHFIVLVKSLFLHR